QRVERYGKTKREALEKLKQAQLDALQGRPVKPERLTVAEHFRDWLAQKKREVASGTYLKYENHSLKHIIPALGHRLLQDLDHRAVNAFYDALAQKGLASATQHDVSSVLRMGLEDAVAKGLIA